MRFVVRCNWKAIANSLVIIMAILMMVGVLIYMFSSDFFEGGNIFGEIILVMTFIFCIVVSSYIVVRRIYNKIIVLGDKIIIKEAFCQKYEMTVEDIKEYYERPESIRARKFRQITIIYGDNKAYEVDDDRVKNYDRLLNYLNRNCKKKIV
ncbi:hypothetical protein [Butyrivibrio sp. M55]|uniref:hypothetical protein n=1 Tax=Butyrivibrio sp. M55 TaxID=1855323 RepID=UPI0008E478E6|nr:hypothetical protein [Butyrivibrio sp. M55]SFU67544.1 hypothetical protein SAMN05216540_105253 [Butyrivibrio sp. M55]